MTLRPLLYLTLAPLVLADTNALLAQAACTVPWRLEETFRLGSVNGEVTLRGVTALTVSRTGWIYVAEPLTSSISVFTPQGRPQQDVGRGGRGPGELLVSAVSLGWKGDTLWVSDINATHFYAPNGREIDQVGFSTVVPLESSTYLPHTVLADGTFLGQRRISGRTMARFFEASRLPLLRFARSGQVLDTLALIDLPTDLLIEGLSDVAHPLRIAEGVSMLPGVAVTPDGAAVVIVSSPAARRPTGFDLIKVAISGDTLWRRTIPYTPRAVARGEEARLREEFGRWMSGADRQQPFAVSPIAVEQKRREAEAAITFPELHPPVRNVVAGYDGSIWLLRELQADGADRWELYDGLGRLQGFVEIREGRSSEHISWAPRLRILRASRDEIWGTTVDDLGVTYLHRYLVRGPC
jgi:hypothetical protein